MNYVVTDGHTVVATRYISSRTQEASSLFFSSGTSFDEYEPNAGLYRMTKADKRERIIMIASEPLTFERADWVEVKTNMMIVITPKVSSASDATRTALEGGGVPSSRCSGQLQTAVGQSADTR